MVQLNNEIVKILNEKKYYSHVNNIDELVNKLIDEYKFNRDIIITNKDLSGVRLNKNTIKRLKNLKYYPTETYNNIIFRLLYDL